MTLACDGVPPVHPEGGRLTEWPLFTCSPGSSDGRAESVPGTWKQVELQDGVSLGPRGLRLCGEGQEPDAGVG